MNERIIELFNDSLERCHQQPVFLDRFYELFLNSSEEVAQKFADTDFKRQKRVLKISLYMLMMVVNDELAAESKAHLERIATLHNRDALKIEPRLYGFWLNCLLKAVAETDPYFDEEIEDAWRMVLAYGIEFMTSRY